jgi:hypothetical protein
MTSGAAGRIVPPIGTVRVPTRWLAAVSALALAMVVLVVPGARAADDPITTTLTVAQEETWWPGSSDKRLRVETTTPDGEWPDGAIEAEVDGDPHAGFMYRSAGYLWITTPSEPGTYPVTVRYRPAAGYAPAEWSGTVTVTEGTTPTTITTQAPARLADGEGGHVDVRVTADGSTPTGRVEMRRDGTLVAVGSLVEGAARLYMPDDLAPGKHRFDLSFYGVDDYRSAHTTVAVEIVKDSRPLHVWIPGGTWDLENSFWKVAVEVPDAYRVGGKLSLYHGDKLLQRIDVEEDPRTEVFVLTSDRFVPGRYQLDVRLTGSPYLEDASASVMATVVRPASSLSADAARSLVWGTKHPIRVQVYPAKDNELNDGRYATGTVSVYRGSTRLGSARIGKYGQATVWVSGTRLPVGSTKIRLAYTGDSRYRSSSAYDTVKVAKATTKVSVKLKDETIKGSQRAKIRVRATSPSDITVTGTLKVKVDGKVVKTVKLTKKHDGERWITLPRLSKGAPSIQVVLAKTSATTYSRSGYAHVWVS